MTQPKAPNTLLLEQLVKEAKQVRAILARGFAETESLLRGKKSGKNTNRNTRKTLPKETTKQLSLL